MSVQEAAPNPVTEQVDGGSANIDGPSAAVASPPVASPAVASPAVASPTVASTTKSSISPPITVKKEPGILETSNGQVSDTNPAEICVVIGGNDGRASGGGSRRPQTEGMFALGTPPPTKSTDSCIGV